MHKLSNFQVCNINLVVDEADIEGVNLIIGEAKMETDVELTEYFITEDPISPTLVYDPKSEHKKGVNLQIIFKRHTTNETMMTFFPSLLLIAISYATSFFKLPNFFNTAITVNLTVMLTITTLLISVVKKLAHTSYIKWIEAWLIFAQLIPFTQVVLITCSERFREQEKKMDYKTVEVEPELVRSKDHCLLHVANRLIKVPFQ